MSGCVCGTGPEEFEDRLGKEADDGPGVMFVTWEVFEFVCETEGKAEVGADAELVNIAGTEAADKAGIVVVVIPQSKIVPGLDPSEQYCKFLSGAFAAWDSEG